MRISLPLPPLPDDFLFGVATSDHQSEAFDERIPDLRDMWELGMGLTHRGRATDFWNRYPEDVELAKGLGCNCFRISIAWSRVEPTPGNYDEAAFDHYHRLLETIRAAGMKTIVTLHHFTWPVHVQERGGMTDPLFPAIFRGYAKEAARRLGHLVDYWVTINEPTMLPFGYIKLWWERYYVSPPGLESATTGEQVDAVVKLIRNLFLAHTAARQEIKAIHPDAKVGSNPLVLGLPTWVQLAMDRHLQSMRTHEDWVRAETRAAEAAPLHTGSADVVLAGLTVTPERERRVLFSEPTTRRGPCCWSAADSAAREWCDVANEAIAVVKHSSTAGSLYRLAPAATSRVTRNLDQALKLLDGRKVAAILSDSGHIEPLAQAEPDRYRAISTPLPEGQYAAAVAHGDQELLELVNAAIRKFKASGAWKERWERHFPGRPAPEPPGEHRVSVRHSASAELDDAEARLDSPHRRSSRTLRAIRRRGKLVVALRDLSPGFSYHEGRTGEWRGLEVDLARAIAAEIFGDPARVVFRPAYLEGSIEKLRAPVQSVVASAHKLWTISSALFNTNWWMLGMAGRLPEFLCPAECVGQQDYVGLDYYWGIDALHLNRAMRLIDAMQLRFERAPVDPSGLYRLLRRCARMFPGQEVLIIENGCVESADGVDRATYIRRHVREVQRAHRAGVNVTGYVCWSITSNREWGLAFDETTDFGLYHIDLDNDPELRRVPTPAAETYRQIIANRGVLPAGIHVPRFWHKAARLGGGGLLQQTQRRRDP